MGAVVLTKFQKLARWKASTYCVVPTLVPPGANAAFLISGEFFTQKMDGNLLADAFFQKGSYSVTELLSKAAELLSSPPKSVERSQASSIWAPTGDAQVMLTCTNCLRSFPIETCEGTAPAKQSDCIFCGVQLDIQFVAIGTASSGSA